LIDFPNDSLVRFARTGQMGSEQPAALFEGQWFDLAGLGIDFSGENLAPDVLADVANQVKRGGVKNTIESPERLGPPLAKANSIVCIGQNYTAHARESGSEPPKVPIVFFKHPSTFSGPFDPVPIPPGALKVDWEVELAVVIGREISYAKDDQEALAAIAGYSISNDVSERFFQVENSGGQWSKGKCFPHFNPFGPFLVPATELSDVGNLRLQSTVDGEKRQDSNTGDMIFTVAQLIRDLSNVMRLVPGDIVNTGTPEGVAFSGRFPYLSPGNRVRLEIQDLGYQEQEFVAV